MRFTIYDGVYTLEKVLYLADSRIRGVYVSTWGEGDTALRKVVSILCGRKLIAVNQEPLAHNYGSYYRITPLGKLYLKLSQKRFAQENKGDYEGMYTGRGAPDFFRFNEGARDALGIETTTLAYDAFGEDMYEQVGALLALIGAGASFVIREHKPAIKIMNQLTLKKKAEGGETTITALGLILFNAMRENAIREVELS